MSNSDSRTTVSICLETKARMDNWRAPGQCYDGFLLQMVELWERMHPGNITRKSASAGNKVSAES